MATTTHQKLSTRYVTLEQILEAARACDLPLRLGSYFTHDDRGIARGCDPAMALALALQPGAARTAENVKYLLEILVTSGLNWAFLDGLTDGFDGQICRKSDGDDYTLGWAAGRQVHIYMRAVNPSFLEGG